MDSFNPFLTHLCNVRSMIHPRCCRLHVVIATLLLWLVAVLLSLPLSAAAVEANRMAEMSFESAKDYADPTSGELKILEGSAFPGSGAREFTPPGKNAAGESDWVLLLETK